MFEILQASWVVAVDSYFKKSPLKEVRWCKVQGSWWSKATPDSAITEEGLQESCCCFHGIGQLPHFVDASSSVFPLLVEQ
jgi:hypothetical protein